MSRTSRHNPDEPPHLTAWRQQEDAARAERRAEENKFVKEFIQAEKHVAEIKIGRKNALDGIEQQVKQLHETSEAEIAAVEKRQTQIILRLKKTNKAEVVAGLLRIPVTKVNRTVSPERRRGAQQKPVDAAEPGPVEPVDAAGTGLVDQIDTAEPKPVDQAATDGPTIVTTPLSPPDEVRPSPQPALFPATVLAAPPTPTATLGDLQLVNGEGPDEARPGSAATDATEP